MPPFFVSTSPFCIFFAQWQFISIFANSKLIYSHLDMKYIADRLKTSIFLVLCLTIVMVTLASCSDNNAEDPDLKRFKNRFSGDYQYSSAIWTGGNIDLDGDGTGHKNLDEEFRGCSGYDTKSASAEVTYDDSEETFRVSAKVPFYAANESDGKIVPEGIIYENFTFKVQWMDDGQEGQIEVSECLYEDMGYPIPDIIYVDVISFTDNSFDVTVECSLYDQHEGKPVKGTVIFTFTRK